MVGRPYRMAYLTGIPSSPWSSAACRLVCTARREPSGVQICWYFSADLAARVRSTMLGRIGNHTQGGGLTTRRSERNSARYSLTAGVDAAAGVQRLTRRTLFIGTKKG